MLALAPLHPQVIEDSISDLVQGFIDNTAGETTLLTLGPERDYPSGINAFIEPWISYNFALRHLLGHAIEMYPREKVYVFTGPGRRFTTIKWEYNIKRVTEALPDDVWVITGTTNNVVIHRKFLTAVGGIPDVDSEHRFVEWARDMGNDRKRLFSIGF